MKKRRHFIITGIVQGVCFRMYAKKEAEHLQLTGWVRNLPDGSVEITVEGEESLLAKFTAWCNKGSPYARVSNVKLEYSSATGEFKKFQII